LAEITENFILLYSKNVNKYDVTSTEFISKYVKENLLDESVKSLMKGWRGIIEETREQAQRAEQ